MTDSLWLFSTIYGHLETRNKNLTWALMQTLAEGVNIPWLICRDFNEIFYANEKWGGNSRQDEHM